MAKFIFVMFSAMTVGAGYMTMTDYGVMEPTIKNVRQGSAHRGMRGLGRRHTGK